MPGKPAVPVSEGRGDAYPFRVFRSEGVRRFLGRVGHRIVAVRKLLVYTRPLALAVDPVRSWLSPEVKRFKEPTREFCRLYRLFTNDTRFERRFVEGAFVDVAFVDGVPAAFQWISLGDFFISSLNATLRLDTKDAYLAEVYVQPAYRGKGVAPLMMNHVYQELFAAGYSRMLALIEVGNCQMLRLVDKRGYCPYYRIALLRMAPFERLIVSPCSREDAGGLSVELVAWGCLPFRRPRWELLLARSPRSSPPGRETI